MPKRKFRLALTIEEDNELEGAHVVMALGEEPDKKSPVVAVQAGGFPPNDTGAAMLADMLEDVASAIREYLSPEVIQGAHTSTDTASLPTFKVDHPVVPRRPKFNPQPRGART